MTTNNPKKKIAGAIGGIENKIRRAVFALFSDITKATPVDTGLARNNWFPEIGKPSNQTTEETDKNGTKTTGEVLSVLRDWNFKQSVFFVNNLPYIRRLEHGQWSKQAPQGMVKKNVEIWEDFFKRNI